MLDRRSALYQLISQEITFEAADDVKNALSVRSNKSRRFGAEFVRGCLSSIRREQNWKRKKASGEDSFLCISRAVYFNSKRFVIAVMCKSK